MQLVQNLIYVQCIWKLLLIQKESRTQLKNLLNQHNLRVCVQNRTEWAAKAARAEKSRICVINERYVSTTTVTNGAAQIDRFRNKCVNYYTIPLLRISSMSYKSLLHLKTYIPPSSFRSISFLSVECVSQKPSFLAFLLHRPPFFFSPLHRCCCCCCCCCCCSSVLFL